MSNTSATGGYLTPSAVPLDDDALLDFMQTVLIGVTGITPKMVRPAYQPNPPKRPGIDVDWCAFWIGDQKVEEGNAYVIETDNGLSSKSQRHEEFQLRCSFYGPHAGHNASSLRDNLQIAQNREQLFLAGMAHIDCSSITPLGDLVDQQWYKRADITANFRRELNRDYSVLSFLTANGTIVTETITIPWAVSPEV